MAVGFLRYELEKRLRAVLLLKPPFFVLLTYITQRINPIAAMERNLKVETHENCDDDDGCEDDGDNGAICIQSRLQRWPAGDH